MKYSIVKAKMLENLEKQVNEFLEKNWEPLGSPFIHDDYVCQAITHTTKYV